MNKCKIIAVLTITGGIAPLNYASAQNPHSTNLHGALGLNIVPSARMDETGTLRAQLGHLDPYLHGFIGVQIADPLYIGIRQSTEFSSYQDDAKNVFPGIDAKLRLVKESAHFPETSLGLQSGLGHKRQSGEYLALSKRYKSFDFTGGIGWGRFASAAHIDNPFSAISNHFDKDRTLDGQNPTKPQDWFTGEDIGFFVGLEYFTPINGLSLKADYGGDSYKAEKDAFDFSEPAPWSLGFNYKPWNFADIGLAAQGTDKIMARLSLQANVKNWRHQSNGYKSSATLNANRVEKPKTEDAKQNAEKDNITLNTINHDHNTISATLNYNQNHAAPRQIGIAAIHLANAAQPSVEAIQISPTNYGLRGPSITLMRKSLENALAHNNGSAEEIWHTTTVKNNFEGIQNLRPNADTPYNFKNIKLNIDNQISLSEEDTSLLRRTSLIINKIAPHHFKHFTSGFGLRLNINDNLGKLKRNRPKPNISIKSDVYDFADRFLAVDNAFIAMPHTILPNWHTNIITGYADEFFAGIGGEVLYRPFDKRYAIGGESWWVKKRDPFTFANLGTQDTGLFTAHLNAYYDIPNADMTLGVKAGSYLARDYGVSATLIKNFENGASVEGYISVTDKSDRDLFGGTTNADHGLRLNIPLGGYKYTPNTNIRVTAAPFARDIGQVVNNPLPLYQATEKFSLAHISRHWNELNQ